ncbi:MAG: hypothetical protein R3B06_29290 [Kofleriaceae bacterium]
MRSSFVLGTSAVALLALAPAARADSLLEFVAGGAIPVADSEYTDRVDNSLKLGVRAAAVGARGAGVELGLDYTIANFDGGGQFAGLSVDGWRLRALVGGRYQAALGGKGFAFARLGAGLDVAGLAVTGTLLGFPVDESQTDLGVALEVGAGIGVRLGKATVGLQAALPIGLHVDPDDQADAHDFDFEYTAVDLDVLASVGTTF